MDFIPRVRMGICKPSGIVSDNYVLDKVSYKASVAVYSFIGSTPCSMVGSTTIEMNKVVNPHNGPSA